MKVITALIAIPSLAHLGLCDIGKAAVDNGKAAVYKPPYLPTKCFGATAAQIPGGNLFGAVGPQPWDNNAACGRLYDVSCLSSVGGTGKCTGATVRIKVIDGRLGPRASQISLSMDAAAKIYTGAGTFNFEYQQV
ncbi:hypothetical protein EG328_008070 [Venturia inaequalis]|uniref:Plant natriuretic peptide-like 1 n=1 Tax=Venturia inaequalis TaxID=5025 RepID=A0A370JAE2_VENIN|nr:hypothetical protein EG327_002614 [Venturia inaequalis]KAE9967624.1 hypothetical protein EG328_008070 [Venturia inaequalis]QDH43446.1 plant natriuretic peptide-like 1 [Venturia inaequalis]RDI82610.1 hypothetical protein Vi05172_g7547 [Venturia inaequalis]